MTPGSARQAGPSVRLKVAVCVPIRDEEKLLPQLLNALGHLDRSGHAFTACFHLDSCVDGSAEILHQASHRADFAVHVSSSPVSADANAGRARHSAMALGLRVTVDPNAVLLCTDADSEPDPQWLLASIAALQSADVVAGRILRRSDRSDAPQDRMERYYDRLHALRRQIDPVPWEAADTHHFGGGANLAMRAGAYRAVGGFRPLPFAEDATLLDDAARAGLRVRHDAALRVTTSSRRQGRALQGLSSALQAMDQGNVPVVAHPANAAWQYQGHALARSSFAQIGHTHVRAALERQIGLTGDHILGVARDCPNAEAFAMRIVPCAPDMRSVTLPEAEMALGALETLRTARAA